MRVVARKPLWERVCQGSEMNPLPDNRDWGTRWGTRPGFSARSYRFLHGLGGRRLCGLTGTVFRPFLGLQPQPFLAMMALP